jgi:radical SAM superfamily enzyme YgiQ (UPF0313 family)
VKVLLTSVFGPYGVDDEYGQASCRMELFHNQVTREQGVFSMRFFHESFGLHFLAENISVPTTVLDFPSEARFVEELRRGYDLVGISFIVANFAKAKRMAELVRRHAPHARIVLGGHGVQIPEVAEEIPHDHLCVGEGVRWLRGILGEDPKAPIRHPIRPATFGGRILGVPVKDGSGHVMPGLGCPNGCRFCSTSHFFGRQYIPYLETGKQIFDLCVAIERALNVRRFFVMDENFLQHPERAEELLALMEKHGKTYRFNLFSSAENITKVGVDFLVRLGVVSLWLGVESKFEVYDKNRGVNFKTLVNDLRDHGISVLTSAILFLDQHDHRTIWEDIRFIVGLEPDLIQFMQLGPVPYTPLYRGMKATGRLLENVPYRHWHGQERIWFQHPHFKADETDRILTEAFRYEYDTLGPALMRMCDTYLRGYRTLASTRDPFLAGRREALKRRAGKFRPFLAAARDHAHNETARELVGRLTDEYNDVFGRMTLRQQAQSQVVRGFAAREARRVAAGRNVYQPRTIVTHYGR